MQTYLTALENTSLSIWVRESGSIWSYPMIITVHAYGMVMLAGVSTLIALRLLGFGAGVPLRAMRPLYSVITAGFWVSLLSGLLLTLGDAASMLISPIFYIKMFFIAAALIAGMRIERCIFRRLEASDAVVPVHGRSLAILSLTFWLGAITAGRLTAYLGPAVALKGINH